MHITLTNHSSKTLQLRLIGIAEWLMGANRSDRGTVRTAVLQPSGWTALLATQRERASGFGEGTAFLGVADVGAKAGEASDWTCDRRECFDARGRLVLPDFFGQISGDGLDPCAALSTRRTGGAAAGAGHGPANGRPIGAGEHFLGQLAGRHHRPNA